MCMCVCACVRAHALMFLKEHCWSFNWMPSCHTASQERVLPSSWHKLTRSTWDIFGERQNLISSPSSLLEKLSSKCQYKGQLCFEWSLLYICKWNNTLCSSISIEIEVFLSPPASPNHFSISPCNGHPSVSSKTPDQNPWTKPLLFLIPSSPLGSPLFLTLPSSGTGVEGLLSRFLCWDPRDLHIWSPHLISVR